MRVLWLTNFCVPQLAEKLGLPQNNKEGWIAGSLDMILNKKREGGLDLELAVLFPWNSNEEPGKLGEYDGVTYYFFRENSPLMMEPGTRELFYEVLSDFKPEVIHIFGTEYPHAAAMLETLALKEIPGLSVDNVLIGMQGVVSECAKHYLDGIPEDVAKRKTFRDFLKGDGLLEQQKKFKVRATNEMVALLECGNVTGRTDFDREYTRKFARRAKYFHMNETLRKPFYEAIREDQINEGPATQSGIEKEGPETQPGTEKAGSTVTREAHRIFLCQCDYPIKGVHYVIEALPKLLEAYPDLKVVVCGDNITRHATLKEKIKISGYGKYQLELIEKVSKEIGKPAPIEYIGKTSTEDMIKEYRRAGLFLLPSTVENSPNALCEAMLLGTPVVAANVGGVSSVMKDGEDGYLYEAGSIEALTEAVKKSFEDEKKREEMRLHAQERAKKAHDPEANFERLLEIYREISGLKTPSEE